MQSKGKEAGRGHTPAIEENSATVYSDVSNLYINNYSYIDKDSSDLQQLRNEPVIRDFANVKPHIYELIKATNPTLLMFVDLARKIVQEGGHE